MLPLSFLAIVTVDFEYDGVTEWVKEGTETGKGAIVCVWGGWVSEAVSFTLKLKPKALTCTPVLRSQNEDMQKK